MTLKLGAVLVAGVITFVSLLSPAGRGEKISRERDRKHCSRLLLVLLFLYCVPTVATNSQTFALRPPQPFLFRMFTALSRSYTVCSAGWGRRLSHCGC